MRYVGRENVRKMLEPLEGTDGRTVYRDGSVDLVSDTSKSVRHMSAELVPGTFEGARHLLVRPSFGLGHEGVYDYIHVTPLLAEIARDHVVSVLLVRLGGYAVGVFDGERLRASKSGSRPVHGRAAAGGRSQKRFARRREGQARVALAAAADAAAMVLLPVAGELAAVVGGGDRRALAAVLADRRLAPLRPLLVDEVLDVPQPRRSVLESAPARFRAVRVRLPAGEPG